MKKRSKTDVVQVPVRMQEFLRANLERAAKERGRSMNAEIVGRLERSLHSEQVGLLNAILGAALGKTPKWVTPDDGLEITFTAVAKTQIKEKIAAFIDSLPQGEPSLVEPMSRERFNELAKEYGGPSPSIRKKDQKQ